MHLEAWTSTDADVELEASIDALEMNGESIEMVNLEGGE
jgi:hypothetical protein